MEIVITGHIKKVSDTSRIYLSLCEKDAIPITEFPGDDAPAPDLSDRDLIVDAMLGTGFTGEARGIPARAIESVNRSGAEILSIDLPSGLPSDGEGPRGPVVRACATVTIGLPKISLVTYPGIEYTGELIIADIGFPGVLTAGNAHTAELANEEYCRRWQAGPMDRDINKSRRGHLLLIGGFPGMEGAILMSAMAALKTGIGYVTLLTTEESRKIVAGKVPEIMTISVNGDSLGRDRVMAAHELRRALAGRKYDAIVLGPGLGRDSAAGNLFAAAIDFIADPGIPRALIDGDGLYHLAGFLEHGSLSGERGYVLTPHLMEASRILSRPVEDIGASRLRYARECSLKTGGVTLLKGPATIVTDGTRSVINTTGNPCLATAGTGDILSGIIGALLLRDIPLLAAAAVGAYRHGLAADLFSRERSGESMRATDLLGYL